MVQNLLFSIQYYWCCTCSFRDGDVFFRPFHWNIRCIGSRRTVNSFNACLSIYHSAGVGACGGYREGCGEFGRGIQLEQVKDERDREQTRDYCGGNAMLELLRARQDSERE